MRVIEVTELVKQYKSAKTPAVKGVSFSVEQGEFFTFLGPNGAGRQTRDYPQPDSHARGAVFG